MGRNIQGEDSDSDYEDSWRRNKFDANNNVAELLEFWTQWSFGDPQVHSAKRDVGEAIQKVVK